MDFRILILVLGLVLLVISIMLFFSAIKGAPRHKQREDVFLSRWRFRNAEEIAPVDSPQDPPECPFQEAEETVPQWLSQPIRAGRWNPDFVVIPEPEPEPAPTPTPPVATAAAPDPQPATSAPAPVREEFVPVAPVEMWLGETRVGVKEGSRTYALLTGYAQTLFDDLRRSRQGA